MHEVCHFKSKPRGYVEAASMMGQKDSKMIFKHILPQLLPYAFASVAISVPAAITTEAGLSFLGLGDPSFPTWGQILHDANTFGAAARGLMVVDCPTRSNDCNHRISICLYWKCSRFNN